MADRTFPMTVPLKSVNSYNCKNWIGITIPIFLIQKNLIILVFLLPRKPGSGRQPAGRVFARVEPVPRLRGSLPGRRASPRTWTPPNTTHRRPTHHSCWRTSWSSRPRCENRIRLFWLGEGIWCWAPWTNSRNSHL